MAFRQPTLPGRPPLFRGRRSRIDVAAAVRQQAEENIRAYQTEWCKCGHDKRDHSPITGRCDLCSCRKFEHDEVEV